MKLLPYDKKFDSECFSGFKGDQKLIKAGYTTTAGGAGGKIDRRKIFIWGRFNLIGLKTIAYL